jgi:hypothetical protein
MDKGIMAARRQLALEKIAKYTGVSVVGKNRSTELRELFTLEAIVAFFESDFESDKAEAPESDKVEAPAEDERALVHDALDRVFGISGVGPAVEAKIVQEFPEIYGHVVVEA